MHSMSSNKEVNEAKGKRTIMDIIRELARDEIGLLEVGLLYTRIRSNLYHGSFTVVTETDIGMDCLVFQGLFGV